MLTIVTAIPSGKVMTYGQVALLAGFPRRARYIGGALQGVREGEEIPWHRVINAQGAISTYRLGIGEMQRALLEAEGVDFDADGHVDLERYRWQVDPDSMPDWDWPLIMPG